MKIYFKKSYGKWQCVMSQMNVSYHGSGDSVDEAYNDCVRLIEHRKTNQGY